MKRSFVNNSAYNRSTKSQKRNNGVQQWRTLKFQDHNVLGVLDNSGVLWFRWSDVNLALDIHGVPSDVHDFCVRKKFMQLLSDINVSDRSLNVPGNSSFIMAEGIRVIVSHSGRPRGRQFMESIFELMDNLPSVNETPAPKTEEVENPYAEENEQLRRKIAKHEEEFARREEEIRKAQENLEQEKRLAEKKLEKWKNVVHNLKSREPTQIVYIATCERYARQNTFKVGGVRNLDLLKGRLAVLNTGRTPEDFYFYCLWVKCSNYRRLEQRITDVIGEHRIKKDAEMYNLHYLALKEVVEYLSERFNEEEEKYRGMFSSLIQETLEKEPVVPNPLIINGSEFRQMKGAEAEMHTPGADEEQRNFDTMNEEEQYSLVANSLEEYITNLLSPTSAGTNSDSVLTRTNFLNHLTRQEIKFKKQSVWRVLKVVAEAKNVKIKY